MLLDHFHAPLHPRYHWESFLTLWACEIGSVLNEVLPRSQFLAEVQIDIGPSNKPDLSDMAKGPTPQRSINFTFPDEVEVRIFDYERGDRLVGVIELVSPSNKDRPESRRAFAGKCAAYLHHGVGVLIVDIVSSKHFNLHHELFTLLGEDGQLDLSKDVYLYTSAYRPAQRKDTSQVDLWTQPLAIGKPLPVMPLALLRAFFVPIDLDKTYKETRRRAGL